MRRATTPARTTPFACIEPLESRIAPSVAYAFGIGSAQNETVQHLQTDNSGNVYVSGVFHGTVDFDPSSQTSNLTAPAGQTYGFIAKYTGAGVLAWVDALAPSVGNVTDLPIAVTPTGDVYLATTFGTAGGGALMIAEDIPHTGNFPSQTQVGSGTSLFLAKIDALGDVQWVQSIGDATTSITAPVIATDGMNGIYVAGIFSNGSSAGTLTIGGSTLNVAAQTQNIFITNFADGPSFNWAVAPTLAAGSLTSQFSNLSLAADGNSSTVTLGAQFSGGVTFPTQPTPVNVVAGDVRDLLVTQLSNSGSFNFADEVINGGAPSPAYVVGDGHGSVYLAGDFTGSTILITGSGVAYTAQGSADAFLLKLDGSGAYQGSQHFAASVTNGTVTPVYLTSDFLGRIYIGLSHSEAGSSQSITLLSQDRFANLLSLSTLPGTTSPSGNGLLLSPGSTPSGIDFAVDSQDVTYLAGNFAHSLDVSLNPSEKDVLTTSGSKGFLVHYLADPQVDQIVQQPGLPLGFKIGGTGDQAGYDIVTDSTGNIYVAGVFSGTVDFDPGSAIHNLTSTDPNGNIFVAKYDSTGHFLWADQVGMNLTLSATGSPNLDVHLALDANGNVYLSGEFEGTATLGTFTLPNSDTTTGANHRDIFIAKLNSSGTYQWAESIGAAGETELVQSMVVEPSAGQVVLGGTFASTVDFDPGAGTTALTASNGVSSPDAYILSLDTTGAFQWVHQMGGVGSTINVLGLALFSNGDVAATGGYTGAVDFGNGQQLDGNPLISSTYIGQFSDTDGSAKSALGFMATGGESGHAIAIDTANGNHIIVAGQFHGTFDPSGTPLVESGFIQNNTAGSPGDAFVLEVDSGGEYINAVAFGGTGADDATSLSINAATGTVFVGGHFENTVDFDPAIGLAKMTAPAGGGIYVSQLNTLGLSFVNAFQIAATTPTAGNGGIDSTQGGKVFVDQTGHTFFTGGLLGSINLDTAVTTAGFKSSGGHDLLIAEFNPAFTADAAHPRSFRDGDSDIVTITVTGPGSVQYGLVDGLGDGSDLNVAQLFGTALSTGIKISLTKTNLGAGTSTIVSILTTDMLQNVGSINVGPTFTLGDGQGDQLLHVSGKINSIVLGDLNGASIIKLGDGLPYRIPGKTGTPDTYNNHPDLTIGNILGDDVLIDVTGDGTAGGVGGGGLGNVVIHSWDHTGILQTTQSVGNFTIQTGDFLGTLLLDPTHLGEFTTANIGNMTITDGSWGGAGTEIEGNIQSFNATAFLAGASITAASIGTIHTTNGAFAGDLTLTAVTAATVETFTVATDFTGTVISNEPLKKINIRGNFTGSLQAPGIAGITAFAFLGAAPANPGDPNPDSIKVTSGFLGQLKSTSGIFQNYTVVTPDAFAGISVNLSHIKQDTVGIDNVNITASTIGNIGVVLAADKTASGIHLTGISNSSFTTSGTGSTKATDGSIGNVSVTLKGNAGVAAATGISDSSFDARVLAGEFGSNPASTINPLGNISVILSGAGGASIGLNNASFEGNTIGKTKVNLTRAKVAGATAVAMDTVSYTADNSIGAMSIGGDATSAQVTALDLWSGGTIGSVAITSKTAANGSLVDSYILAGQALTYANATTTKELTAHLKGASLGAVSVTGSITNSNIAAGSNIGAITVGGAMSGTDILAGSLLGADRAIGGGDDSFYRAAGIAGIIVKGNFGSSVISAGIDPVSGGFGDGDDALGAQAGTLTTSSSIGAIRLGEGSALSSAPSLAHAYVIQAAALKSLSLPHIKTINAFASPAVIDLTGDGETVDDVLIREIGNSI